MKAIQQFDFKASGRGTYDWDTMMDGNIYQAVKGEDFQCEVETFVLMLRNRSMDRGKRVKVDTNGDTVTFQAIELSEAEQEARTLRRDQLKAKRAENKAKKEADAEKAKADAEAKAAEELAKKEAEAKPVAAPVQKPSPPAKTPARPTAPRGK